MKLINKRPLATAALLVVLELTSSAQIQAQQATGESGSPSATTTLDGKQLPPPAKFGGVIRKVPRIQRLGGRRAWSLLEARPMCCASLTDDQGYGSCQ